MAGKVKHARLESRSSRDDLKRRRQPHWQAVQGFGGKVHLGWQCWKGDPAGRWIMRRYVRMDKSKNDKPVAKYRTTILGLADDDGVANGSEILTYDQAVNEVRKRVDTGAAVQTGPLTVKKAMELYIDYKRGEGVPEHVIKDLTLRSESRILPGLGPLVVSEIKTDDLRRWLSTMAASPAQTRPKDGKLQFRSAPATEEEVRRRRVSANRVLTILKAALNYAFDEERVSNRDAWGRKLKPYKHVEVARTRYLKLDEAKRLLNACAADFRPLVRAALESGCRYGELTRLEVEDFNSDAGTLMIRQTKSGPPRFVTLTEAGAAFFKQHCAGRNGLLFLRNGKRWQKSEQARPMREACKQAGINPAIGFHQLRHTWASLAVMNGLSLMMAAENLGHTDTRMVEKHYKHLAPSFITKAIRESAPVYGITEPKKVVPLSGARRAGRSTRR
jgi:integrase